MAQRLFNDSQKISASEINKFTYCPYQWYYERKHGKKHLIFLRKELLEKLNLTDTTKSNFVKGQRFHENYSIENKSQKKYLVLAILLILLAILYFISDLF